jgi:biopolymer transport protein ExbB
MSVPKPMPHPPPAMHPPSSRFPAIARPVLLAAALAWAPAAAAQDEPAPPPPAAGVKTKTALDYYQSGGSMMHLLLLCSVGTIAVLGYSFMNVSEKKMAPKGLFNTLLRHLRQREVSEAYQLCQDNRTAFTNVVGSALLKVNFERDLANKASMEQALADALDEEETRQMLWVNYLNVFATIAPMIGLLGTVSGMILSFDMLAAGKSDPSDLAGGIGVAMITTAGGLLVGIPAMFFYFFFRNRVMGIMTGIQKNATFLIDVLSGEVKLEGGEQS